MCAREASESGGAVVSDPWFPSCPEHSGIARAGQLLIGLCLQLYHASDSTQWQKWRLICTNYSWPGKLQFQTH